ncbi:hypothetical protein WLH_04846 [Escherichia coli O25b:H4]|uniref:Uncharacterized protein n=1 Tax=Escherichia coli O25b:H4 TaxID=941280 RepID=A0A192CK64_ECO25|nr:hypothetical protein WLH_04846 [Escherichia coli O25b:H4]
MSDALSEWRIRLITVGLIKRAASHQAMRSIGSNEK